MLPKSTNAPLVTELFQAQVAKTPRRLAVIHGPSRLSYAELDDQSTQLARALARRGVGKGHLVAVCLENSLNLVSALLAVLKSGAGYLPINVTDPSRRIDYILRDARACLVVVDAANTGPPPGATRVMDLSKAQYEHIGGLTHTEVSRGDVAYVVYTSGTTGHPKGVVIEHGALASYLSHVRINYPGVRGRVILHSPVSFDMAVTSLYGPLVTGGTLEVAALEDLAGADESAPWFIQPTFLKVTPSHLRLLQALAPECSPRQQLVIGGEALTAPAVETWRREHPSATVINEYGPTEATVGCCAHVVPPGGTLAPGPVPIGLPTPGARLFALDTHLKPVRDGEIGELYISGDQLGRGYLGHPGLTAASFVASPFGPPGSRMYRSGDLVQQRPDGSLNFMGRADQQVKIGGVRIEPSEVAAVVADSGQVADVVVTTRAVGSEQQLVAYVTTPAGVEADISLLREHVSARLPGPMRPAAFVVMEALPLTGNGKINHDALPAPGDMAQTSPSPPRTGEELVLIRLFGELTGVTSVGVDDDFFTLGGSSLAAARLVVRARREGIFFSLQDVLAKRTVRNLAESEPEPSTQREDRA